MLKEAKHLRTILHHLYTYSSVDILQILEKNRSLKNWNFFYFLICFCHSIIKILYTSGVFHKESSCNITKFDVQINTFLVEVSAIKGISVRVFTLKYIEFRTSIYIFLQVLYKGTEDTFEEGFKYLIDKASYSSHFADTKDKNILSAIINSLTVENLAK